MRAEALMSTNRHAGMRAEVLMDMCTGVQDAGTGAIGIQAQAAGLD